MNSSLDAAVPAAERVAPSTTPAWAPEEFDLAWLWSTILGGRWRICAAVLLASVLAAAYLFVATPIYRADALLQIRKEGNSALQGLMDLEGQLGTGGGSQSQAEIEILRSRSVLGQTVQQLGLEVSVSPVLPPYVGAPLLRFRGQPQPVAEVTRLLVPDGLVGRVFTLRALDESRFELYDDADALLLSGVVGSVAVRDHAGDDLQVFVRSLSSSAFPQDFRLRKLPWVQVAQQLRGRLVVSEQGRDSGVLRLEMDGADPVALMTILNTISDTYVRQSVEARSEEAERSLEFLNGQLPVLRAELQAAESRYALYRKERQAADLDAEGQMLLNQLVKLEEEGSRLDLRVAELQQTYTEEHPALQAIRDQRGALAEDRTDLEARIARLPDAQKEILRLRRDVEVTTSLYTALLNRSQELRVLKAGTTGNVRIIDRAPRPLRPVAPRTSIVVIAALFVGFMIGVGVVLLQALLQRGVLDPKEIEASGIPVYSVIPFSPWLARNSRGSMRTKDRSHPPLLARDRPDEPTVEGLRSMRTNLYFARNRSERNIILVGGPAPGIGKSFVSLNLGYLLADVGQRVVVVDADLRKGRLHEFLGGSREPGLSELLADAASLDECIKPLALDSLALITSGRLPPNPSELLMRDTLSRVLDGLRERYDTVIVDAPPVLAVTDASVIAASVPDIMSFLVVRAGMHTMGEIEESARRMATDGSGVAGVVFNGMREEHARYGGGAGSYYRYEYRPGGD